MNLQKYSIKDLELISGIKAHTIRIWEKRYRIFTPGRTSSNIRYYSDHDLKKLLNISVLINQGYKISRLAIQPDEELNEKVRSTFSSQGYESVIDGLVIDMIGFDRILFERRLSELIDIMGFEEAVCRIVYPFFHKIGILWQTSVINPAQEHFISNIIRQKFFSAIDSQDAAIPDAKTFLLYLPENEQHELGLLFSYYLIRKQGHTGVYLGQNVPLLDVVKTWNATKADFLVTSLTSLIGIDDLVSYFTELSAQTSGTPVLVSGHQVDNLSAIPAANVKIIKSPANFKAFLNKV